MIEQAAAGVQTEMFYAYDNANSALYDQATGHLNPAGVAYFQTEQWLTGATLGAISESKSGVYTLPITEPNGNHDLLVWTNSGNANYKPAPNFHSYENISGQTEAVGHHGVEVGTVPVMFVDPAAHHFIV